jgi:hypothetical protein
MPEWPLSPPQAGFLIESMLWNREEFKRLLDAEIVEPESPEYPVITINFRDALMRYQILVFEGKAMISLGADPESPLTGLPCFEISLPCSAMSPVVRSGMPIGIGIYLADAFLENLCFSITRREDGLISMSGMWNGMFDRLKEA